MLKTILILAAISASVFAGDKFVCYYGSWSVYRQGNGKFPVENIDPNLCTHLIYGFVGINSDGSVRIMDSWNDVDLGALKRFNALKEKNSNLKTLIAIGGWNEGSTTFSNVVKSAALRANFIASAISFMQTYGFDGFDLDWEYPSQRGGAATDKDNFSILLAEFRAALEPLGYLLTAAVAAAGSSVDLSYDVPKLSQYLDFINVMTYDLHGAWESTTGQNAPLYASSIDVTENQKLLNVDACIRGWISRGAAPEKIILGVGTYGRSFTLASSSNNRLGAASTGAGLAGSLTGESGFLGYNEICQNVLSNGFVEVWDDEQKVPYAYKGNQWVGYDNPRSIEIKVDYAKSLGLGGVMVWSVETDDFTGACGTVNPILNTIAKSLELPTSGSSATTASSSSSSSASVTSSTAAAVTTSEAAAASSESAGADISCSVTGYFRDSSDLSIFYYCDASSGIVHQFNCPGGLIFDLSANVCNYANLVVS